jgi:outer membrane protein TolC
MGKRQDLESALAGAEADLAQVITNRARAHAEVADRDAKVEKARAVCRQLHDALVELIHAEPPPKPVTPTSTSIRGVVTEAPSAKRPRQAKKGLTGKRQDLESALAMAEADLTQAVTDRAKAHASLVDADAKIERARAVCRHLHDALVELIRAEPPPKPAEPAETSTQGVVAEAAPSTRPRQTIRRFLQGFLAGKLGSANAASRRMLARQSFMLLALVLAYLQYYFFDVNLQVVRLPSITVMVFG